MHSRSSPGLKRTCMSFVPKLCFASFDIMCLAAQLGEKKVRNHSAFCAWKSVRSTGYSAQQWLHGEWKSRAEHTSSACSALDWLEVSALHQLEPYCLEASFTCILSRTLEPCCPEAYATSILSRTLEPCFEASTICTPAVLYTSAFAEPPAI